MTPAGSPSLIIVVSGPGGVGKGTIVDALVGRDTRLWLSRSWTTRAQRPGEPDDAYVFTDAATFERRIEEGGEPLSPAEEAIIDAYEADKAVYEDIYEARNRPSWVDIPLQAIDRIGAHP